MKNDNIYNVLNSYLKRNNGESTNEVICRFMLNHLMEIPQMSVNEIADACFTSHPSIIRFTRELGFEGIADFKYAVQGYIDEVNSKEMRVRFPVETNSDDEDFMKSLNAWIDHQSRVIVSSIGKADRKKMKQLCQEIHAHKKVVVIGSGLSDVVLELFRIELARCGKIVSNIGTQDNALDGYDKKEAMAIILSMNGYYLKEVSRKMGTVNMKKYLEEHCDRSWLITMNKKLKNNLTDELIVIDCEKTSFEFSLNTAIIYFELVGQCYQEMFDPEN